MRRSSMKKLVTFISAAVLLCASLSVFCACAKDPEYDVYVNFYCYYDEERFYDEIPLNEEIAQHEEIVSDYAILSIDKRMFTWRIEQEGMKTCHLSHRIQGYYYITYEVFYTTGVPYKINREETVIRILPADSHEYEQGQDTITISKEFPIAGSTDVKGRKCTLKIEFY